MPWGKRGEVRLGAAGGMWEGEGRGAAPRDWDGLVADGLPHEPPPPLRPALRAGGGGARRRRRQGCRGEDEEEALGGGGGRGAWG